MTSALNFFLKRFEIYLPNKMRHKNIREKPLNRYGKKKPFKIHRQQLLNETTKVEKFII